MHEYALAEAVIAAALDAAAQENLSRIETIQARVGELQRIDRDTFDFALAEVMPSSDARLDGTRVHVEIVPARCRCRACHERFGLAEAGDHDEHAAEAIHFVPELARAFLRCPGCASPDFEVIAGRGVTIASITGEREEDPRPGVLARRLASVKRLVAVTGGKGGIGKSLVASSLAIALRGAGQPTGLLDLDLTSPTGHMFLGASAGFPEETFGVDPPVCHGIEFMTLEHFAGRTPAALRGEDVTNALLELLAVTRWGDLEVLVIDMPPGLGDAMLDTVRLLPRAEYLVVATPDKVVIETVGRTLELLARLRVPVVGVVENMRRRATDGVSAMASGRNVTFLGALPFDDTVESAIGDPARLANTPFSAALRQRIAAVFPALR